MSNLKTKKYYASITDAFQVKKETEVAFHVMLRPAISVQLQQHQIEMVVGFYIGLEDATESKVSILKSFVDSDMQVMNRD